MAKPDREPDKTIKIGSTTIHFFAPAPMTEEELQKRLDKVQEASWACWNSLSEEEQLELNSKYK
ncbi:MAG: hypothetical protein K0Q53_1375 [Massilibacillus sp.]|jgi:hypothetical protein|nr:hypothetical protein [Massilibacillus sp.]